MSQSVEIVAAPTPTAAKQPTIIIGPDKIPFRNSTPDHILSTLKMVAPPAPEGLKVHDRHEARGRLLTCVVDVAPGVSIKAYAWDHYIFITANTRIHDDQQLHLWQYVQVEVQPFVSATVEGNAFHKTVEREVRTGGYGWRSEKKQIVDEYNGRYDHTQMREIGGIPWNYLNLRVTAFDDGTEAVVSCKFARPEAGALDLDAYGDKSTVFRASNDFFGLKLQWDESLSNAEGHYSDDRWPKVHRLLKTFDIKQGKPALWARFFTMFEDRASRTKGSKATENKKAIAENLSRLKKEEPLLSTFFGWLHDERTRKGVSNNSLLSAFLEARGTDYDTLKASMATAMEAALATEAHGTYRDQGEPETRNICLALPGAKDKDEERRSKKEWYLKKSAREQGIGLGISPEAHPKLLKAVEEQRVPLSVFHKAGDQLALVNVEFDLWEKAFERPNWEEVLCRISQDASRRTTYDKAVTPYIAFLFRIEGYLTRNTPKGPRWRSMPKFVESEWELEMAEVEEGGTTKRRSALTPVPDNETRVLTVPYVAMAVRGIRTTYCYSLDYQVFEESTVDRESSTPIVNELERKLNGRDDYGLMYYTLTGTPQNTGYPAFLIIFERRKLGTHVHFHRVHPCRSKEGRPTPACRLVEECYRYMAGNVRAEEIYAQQGDLIFLKTEQTVEIPDGAKHVKEFESHAFKPMEEGKGGILLIPNETKSIKNRLGFIYSEGIFMVDHPEHEPIKGIPAGMYEVRRCKSWEANPKAVWVLTID